MKLFTLIFCLLVISFSTDSLGRDKIIIAVHGLSNKPPARKYETWWKTSILEGLKGIDSPYNDFEFTLFYWADMLYKDPMHNDTNFYFDDRFDRETYTVGKSKPSVKFNWFKDQWNEAYVRGKSFAVKRLYIPVPDELTNMVLEKTLRDLAFYFENKVFVKSHDNETMLVRDALQRELRLIIKNHKDKDILLIGHSMGSIIAYDVLNEFQFSDPNIKIKYFVTIGSPMGIPPVSEKMKAFYQTKLLIIPTNITKGWINFSDEKDNAAFDPILSDNFVRMEKGIEITDELVDNDYLTPTGIANHHKEYGYMRTKKFARLVQDFLNDK